MQCPRCGFESPVGFKFCGACGASLDAPAVPVPGPMPPSSPSPFRLSTPDAERRQLTVMFCDLVGSTALSMRLDPEELREVVRSYQRVSALVVDRYEGYIAQYLGDGILVYFGYPMAHEDEAERAVRAGLDILDGIETLGRRLKREKNVDLSVRIGIHTGLVVVGEMGGGGRRERLAMGDVPNIAARLQGLAAPSTLVVSEATYRLMAHAFAVEDLGRQLLKGVSVAQSVYRVLGEPGLESPLDVFSEGGIASPVGRKRELDHLVACWKGVRRGKGEVVLLSGEAGIGKSTLVQAFRRQLEGEAYARFECRCSPYYQNTAFYPLVDLLQRVLNFYPEQPQEDRLDLIALVLERNGFVSEEAVPLMASLLSIPFEGQYPALEYSPLVRKERIQTLLLELLLKVAEERPLALFMEDLHWADPSTLALLDQLILRVASVPVFVLCTFRPEFRVPWPAQTHMSRLPLARLEREQVEQIVEQVTKGKVLPDQVLEQIATKTDGIPLFVEELTKMVLESGLLDEEQDEYVLQGKLPSLAIPTTLHDSLMARLDRLAPVKEVAQLGAVLGRAFPYTLLRAVSALEEAVLRQALHQLVEAELLYQKGTPPDATYVFKHALIQDTAYQSLLRSQRQQYHERVARVLEREFEELIQAQPELLAHHYTEAGVIEPAVRNWQKAGQQSLARFANVEAIGHLRRGLELLGDLDNNLTRLHMELDLQAALGPALVMNTGYATPEVEATYTRAVALCRRVGDEKQLFWMMLGLLASHVVRVELKTAYTFAEELLAIAEGSEESALHAAAHLTIGITLFLQGEGVSAHEHLMRCLSFYDPAEHGFLAALYGQDVGVTAHSYLALNLWVLGRPNQALAHSRAAIELGTKIKHPHSLGLALSFAMYLGYYLGDIAISEEHGAALEELSIEQRFQHWLADATLMKAWTLARKDSQQACEACMRQALETAQAQAGYHAMYNYYPVFADVLLSTGKLDEGLSSIQLALSELEDKTFSWWCVPELHRLRGALLEAGGSEAKDLERVYREALEQASRQGLHGWALRAAVSLGRVLKRLGREEEARILLDEQYGHFEEGFETTDLREARQLRDQLSTASGSTSVRN